VLLLKATGDPAGAFEICAPVLEAVDVERISPRQSCE
jgi:hypothetical protein